MNHRNISKLQFKNYCNKDWIIFYRKCMWYLDALLCSIEIIVKSESLSYPTLLLLIPNYWIYSIIYYQLCCGTLLCYYYLLVLNYFIKLIYSFLWGSLYCVYGKLYSLIYFNYFFLNLRAYVGVFDNYSICEITTTNLNSKLIKTFIYPYFIIKYKFIIKYYLTYSINYYNCLWINVMWFVSYSASNFCHYAARYYGCCRNRLSSNRESAEICG